MASDLEVALSKIRTQTSSSLPHQKAPANLLKAVEATFAEQNTKRTPAAYFASLLTTLESTVQNQRSTEYLLGDGDVLPAELYLLALVTPCVPFPIIRTNLQTVLSITSPLWPSLKLFAPPLRSQLSIIESVILALERPQLQILGVRQSFASILEFCADPRPKVRKRATEAVRSILSSPPSPLLHHPYSERAAEWSLQALNAINTGVIPKKAEKSTVEDVTGTAIHLISFLRSVMSYFSQSAIPSIIASLLKLPRLGNPYLTQSVYSTLFDLLSSTEENAIPHNLDIKTSDIISIITSSPPSKTDTTITSSWLQLIGQAMLFFLNSDPDGVSRDLGKIWKLIFSYLESNDVNMRKNATDALICLTQCITPALIDTAVEYDIIGSKEGMPTLLQMISQTSTAFNSLSYARATPQLLAIIASLIDNLRYRPQGRDSSTGAELFLSDLIEAIGELRTNKHFEHKEAADHVLQSAMSVMGPEVLLRMLPLNLEPEDRAANREPRAFLLPLLAAPHPAPLMHFISYFVPLTERMFNLQQKAESENRDAEAKVWSVLVLQIWNGLPAYCYNARQLEKVLTPQFSQLLSQLLYNQPELRSPILKALKRLIETNSGTESVNVNRDLVLAEEAKSNLDFLRSQAESWFAVLFNLFGSTGLDSHGMIGEVINSFASITDEKEIAKTFDKVKAMLTTNLGKVNDQSAWGVVVAMLEIMILLIPYLPSSQAKHLFELCMNKAVLTNRDNAVQKRAYKILSKLVEDGDIDNSVENVLQTINDLSGDSAAAARKDRLNLFSSLVQRIPSTSLHVIPSLIPEAVLGTKEPSEKTRLAAFSLIIVMGQKMNEEGIIKRSQIEGMDDDVTDVKANVEEFITMVAGGLAGATPHMISATITAISRLLFEFKDQISATMQNELVVTHLVFLGSANREIVKSTLGFVKLAIHTLPVNIIEPHLKSLVQGLLNWAHDHKNHFKDKVRHIFERLIRRFSWDTIYSCISQDEDTGKFLLNIKKRKDRAKRKKASAREADDDNGVENEESIVKHTTGDAFEDILYGSESDLDESDVEHRQSTKNAGKSAKKASAVGFHIRADDDEPMDLLQDAKSHLSLSKAAHRKRNNGGEKFKVNEETGKMIVDEEDSESKKGKRSHTDEDVVGTAYRENITSVDGFTRRPNGQIKFHKDTKKRRRENEELEGQDIEMLDETQGNTEKKGSKRREVVKLGQEFKAKRAGGDLKKGGTDPYAYLPLSQAAKKKKTHQRVSITGRR